ncbi:MULTISPECIES: Fpg/Nei family DNA glycosylase [Nocardiopsis]|uniref:DNA-(apurinic or apyrimidinic site) lyase n=1 Tax=Nocardiopsis dassonvillei (strain ATCC 23218 / DSM 43111 / CIP 107115 / JCM 7437 / KCTC 9190 / NBRC 14626 / NCTC 10488 / NRRL B-5397 / IMRU 509) TaxID=446468 RepID=D7B537_NOCDD|nr:MULTISPECIES: DNA-formamidopyrimidine glycosylase family protein [Nocardiopsis]ADH69058.1 DNA-(apurinic or apyrimidinic site) lyase [Nocardiopsis dassonvillei subsp. dassonvillei DSM 43111]ASU60052.1 Fpg/Nei family DNA glycosylase [Nocardiopsis dassonvillei]NKY78398.1 Fpg/Nei family DNA glycosylase [Nocardiopsis dassonvillei]VEI89568.1 Formamidopyrimidine-DNA glycosylase [Nocardiopsis dassonvillei]
MPEGHTLHRLAAHFDKTFGGGAVRASSPQGRFADGAARIDGRVLTESEAHGKHLFLGFDSGEWLRVHLGLYGAWSFGDADGERHLGAPRAAGGARRELLRDAEGFVVAPEPVGAVRARLVNSSGWADLRGPSACEVVTEDDKRAVQDRLGPDPLRDDADPERAWRVVSRSRTSIAALLMRQDVVAGIGNIYRAESLFRAGLDPMTPGRDLTADQWSRLWDDLSGLLRDGVRDGYIITTLPEHRPDPDARPVPRPDSLYVCYRTGEPCRVCSSPVASAELAGRTLYWCPRCQGV